MLLLKSRNVIAASLIVSHLALHSNPILQFISQYFRISPLWGYDMQGILDENNPRFVAAASTVSAWHDQFSGLELFCLDTAHDFVVEYWCQSLATLLSVSTSNDKLSWHSLHFGRTLASRRGNKQSPERLMRVIQLCLQKLLLIIVKLLANHVPVSRTVQCVSR